MAIGCTVNGRPEAGKDPRYQQALSEAVREVAPAAWRIVKGPSIRKEQSATEIGLADDVADEDFARVAEAYQTLTGYRLLRRN